MVLYNVLGEAFEIRPESWAELLSLAHAYGWRPAGTAPPPVCLDLEREPLAPAEDWPGAYLPPLGQEVTRADARSLAAALKSARLPIAPRLAAFCRRGGFVLSAAADAARPYRPPVEAAPAAATLECVSS